MKINEIFQYTFKELLPLVVQVVKSGRVPAIWGPPGIGKSALGRKVAEELSKEYKKEVGLYILDAPLLLPYDYAVAVPDRNTETVKLYKTGYLPDKGPAVVLIEDLPHAKTYQMIPIMQIVLDHRIGNLYFADDVYFIITGNREEDQAGVNPLPSPLNNRLVHFEMSADLDEWLIWAKGNGVDERVTGFLVAYPQYFLELPKEGVKAWPTPRSWHMFSDCIKGVKDTRMIKNLCAAAVGDAVASIFGAWYEYLRGIDTEAIITKGEIIKTEKRHQQFAIITAVASRIKKMTEKDIMKYGENLRKFFNSLEGEYKAAFLKELIIYDKDGKDKDGKYIYNISKVVPEAGKYIRDLILDNA